MKKCIFWLSVLLVSLLCFFLGIDMYRERCFMWDAYALAGREVSAVDELAVRHRSIYRSLHGESGWILRPRLFWLVRKWIGLDESAYFFLSIRDGRIEAVNGYQFPSMRLLGPGYSLDESR